MCYSTACVMRTTSSSVYWKMKILTALIELRVNLCYAIIYAYKRLFCLDVQQNINQSIPDWSEVNKVTLFYGCTTCVNVHIVSLSLETHWLFQLWCDAAASWDKQRYSQRLAQNHCKCVGADISSGKASDETPPSSEQYYAHNHIKGEQ